MRGPGSGRGTAGGGGAPEGGGGDVYDVDVDWAVLDDFDDDGDDAGPVIALDDDPCKPDDQDDSPRQRPGRQSAHAGVQLTGATEDPKLSAEAPALSASQPWTEPGVTFTGLRVAVSGGGVARLCATIVCGGSAPRQAVLSPAALAALTGLPATAASNALRSIASMPRPAELPLVARLAGSLAAFRGDAELVQVTGAEPALLLRALFARGTQAVDAHPVRVIT